MKKRHQVIERPLTIDELNERMRKLTKRHECREQELRQKYNFFPPLERSTPKVIEKALTSDELNEMMRKMTERRECREQELQQRIEANQAIIEASHRVLSKPQNN